MFYWRCQHWRQNVFFNWLELSDVMIKSHIWMNKSWHVLWTLFQITQSFSFVFVFSKRIVFGSRTVTSGCKKFATFASEWRDEFAKEKWGKKAVAPLLLLRPVFTETRSESQTGFGLKPVRANGFCWILDVLRRCTKEGPSCHYPPRKIPSHRQVGW